MERADKIDAALEAIAQRLAGRRSVILQSWRKAVDADPELTTATSLPRTQFNDHIPELLDALERTLRAWPQREDVAFIGQAKERAAGHGLQRWQQGYQLREVTREWGHLHLCLVDELELYAREEPDIDSDAIAIARRTVTEFCNRGVSESTVQYFQLQQTEAVGHVRDLGDTLYEVKQLETRRAELLRQAAHDLRGNFGVVSNVTSGLTLDGVPDAAREEFLRLLKKSVSSQQAMLDDLMNLARLQAGHELRDVKAFDAGTLLNEVCDSLQFMATERGLYLKRDGPAGMTVEGDAMKVRRIAQNLLLNALKYTRDGGVTVSWGESRTNDPKRWMLCVHDTGPGFHAGPGAPLAGALQAATQDARDVDEKAGRGADWSSEADSPPAGPDRRPIRQERGEGVGLSIVKRLCELLDASIELESTHGEGTTFRVVIPRHYGLTSPKR
ncbi:MAG TPA: sensor histidine kinase [Casimicrobiaceae bacterium]|jgi:signal transduction histidine kinase